MTEFETAVLEILGEIREAVTPKHLTINNVPSASMHAIDPEAAKDHLDRARQRAEIRRAAATANSNRK